MPGVVRRVSEARPLLTLTTTGAADRCSSGKKAWVTRTTPKTFVSNTDRMSSAVTSAAQYHQGVASTGLEANLKRFDADYQALGTTLGVR